MRLDREAILKEPLGPLWLMQYLAGFGFHPDLSDRIFHTGLRNGLRFRGKIRWELYSHAGGWFLVPAGVQETPPIYLQAEDSELYWCGHRLRIRLLRKAEADLFPRSNKVLHFDAESLEWPLVIRSVQAGDRMRKLSGGHVKVGDLFTNLKIPTFQRPLMPLLYSGGELLCIPGLTRSGTHIVTERSKNVLVIIHE